MRPSMRSALTSRVPRLPAGTDAATAPRGAHSAVADGGGERRRLCVRRLQVQDGAVQGVHRALRRRESAQGGALVHDRGELRGAGGGAALPRPLLDSDALRAGRKPTKGQNHATCRQTQMACCLVHCICYSRVLGSCRNRSCSGSACCRCATRRRCTQRTTSSSSATRLTMATRRHPTARRDRPTRTARRRPAMLPSLPRPNRRRGGCQTPRSRRGCTRARGPQRGMSKRSFRRAAAPPPPRRRQRGSASPALAR